MEASFYSRQPDRPFRVDRFTPRCVMSKVQSLGLVEYDNASISVPMLAVEMTVEVAGGVKGAEPMDARLKRQLEREYFDIAACGGTATRIPSPLPSAKPSGSTVPSASSISASPSADEADRRPGRRPITPITPAPATSTLARPPSLESRGRPPRLHDTSRGTSPSRAAPPAVNRSASIASTSRSVSGASTIARKPFTPALISRFAAQAKATPTVPVSQADPPRTATWTSFFRGSAASLRTPSSSQVTPRAIEPIAVKGVTHDYLSAPGPTLASTNLPTIPASGSSDRSRSPGTQPIAIRGRTNNAQEMPASSMNQLISASYSSSAAGATPPNVVFPLKPLVPSQDSAESIPKPDQPPAPRRLYTNPSNPRNGPTLLGNAREPKKPDHSVHWK
jgi:hypothetical protein